MGTCRGDALFTEEAFWPKQLLLLGEQERWEEGLSGVPGAAVLLCLLGEEAGVGFPICIPSYKGKAGWKGIWVVGAGLKGWTLWRPCGFSHSWVSPHS